MIISIIVAMDAYMDVGGTISWMKSVESSLEQRPRQRLEQVVGKLNTVM